MSSIQPNLLLSELMNLDDASLDELVVLAKRLKVEDKRSSIPEAQIKSLVAKQKRLEEGQSFAFRINPTFTFTVKVGAESGGYSGVTDWDVEISEDTPGQKGFVKVFGRMFKSWMEEWYELHHLDDRIHPAIKEEGKAYDSFIRDRLAIRDQFGVDPDRLLAEVSEVSDD